jgi:dTDP-4-dehydrorhamnose reductase
MIRVLIIGGAGMLGHKLVQTLQPSCDVFSIIRSWHPCYAEYGMFDKEHCFFGTDISDFDALIRITGKVRPDVIVNCVGVIKQLPTSKDPIVSIAVNSLFPHRMAALCRAIGSRFIHISTDCVFDGLKGNYSELDAPNATDLYGRSKQLGEVSGAGSLTIRTSIIGRELRTASGLVEWFLGQRGKPIKGFSKAIFSGLTTLGLSRIIASVIHDHPQLSGIYQVSTDPINKFDLLERIGKAMKIQFRMDADESLVIDRSLNSQRFRTETGITIPSWDELVSDLASDATPYESVRGHLS